MHYSVFPQGSRRPVCVPSTAPNNNQHKRPDARHSNDGGFPCVVRLRMQLTQHAEVGGLEGQESSASSLWSLTRVGGRTAKGTDSGPGHRQVTPVRRFASFLLLPTPGLAYQDPSWHSPGPGSRCARLLPDAQTPPPPRPSAGAGARLRTRFSSSAGNLV